MAVYEGFASYDSSSYWWSVDGILGTFQPGSSNAGILVYALADGTFTWITGTGLARGGFGDVSWTTLATVEHRAANGSLIERISGFDASIANNSGAANGHEFGTFLSLADTAVGHAGADVFWLQGGNDTITMTGGADTMIGGGGDDTYLFSSSGQIVAGLDIRPGSGTDHSVDTAKLDFSGSATLSVAGWGGIRNFQFMNAGALTLTINAGTPATDWRNRFDWTGGPGADHLVFNNAQDGVGGGHAAAVFTSWTAGIDTVTINGNAGNEQLQGSSVDDTINALGGGDFIYANAGNDTINGGDGDDNIIGGLGNDSIDGGAGTDVLNYTISNPITPTTSAVSVVLGPGGSGTATGGADIGTDSFSSIEFVYGTGFGDTFVLSDPAANSIVGNGGMDAAVFAGLTAGITMTLDGTGTAVNIVSDVAGNDYLSSIESVTTGSGDDLLQLNGGSNLTFNAGGGTDTVSITAHPSAGLAVVVDLAAGTLAPTGGGWTITLGSFENVIGGAHADTITGNNGANVITGRNGADAMNGAGGIDTLDYSLEAAAGGGAGVYVDFAGGFAQDGFGNYDTISNFESMIGTDQLRSGGLSDVLLGNNNANLIDGRGGLDYIVGNGGNDTILTGAGDGGTTGDIVVAGAGNDSVTGGNEASFIYGNDGSDLIDGGGGN
ncbi:MAG: beta strand repeat-containing protein, partial [Hyphomicrobiaceae bacterium]